MSKKRKIKINGLPITIVSEPEAEMCDMVVCMRDTGPPYLPTANHFGKCSRCAHPIFWSKSSPILPPKVCIECVMADVGGEIKH